MEILGIKELSFSYPDEISKALVDIELSVSEGEFVLLCGISGSGKSTLLKMIIPQISPAGTRNGIITFRGCDISEKNTARIGVVMQSPDNQIITENTISELAFGLESMGIHKQEMRRRIAEMSNFFGLDDILGKKTTELSGGQKQILNIASVMLMQPELLLLDEPFSQLDPVAASQLADILHRINSEIGTTIIIAEHSPEPVYPICSRVILLSEGRIIADDLPQNVPAEILKSGDPVFDALPLAARACVLSDVSAENIPLTIQNGRKWLRKFIQNHQLKSISHIQPPTKTNEQAAVISDHVWFRYRKNDPFILRNASFRAYSGEILAILGGNGAGKSTLLQVITGSAKQQEGSIRIKNGARIAYMPQSPELLFTADTLYSHFEDCIKASEAEPSDEIIKKTAEFFELEEKLRRHPYDLSGGEQQKAALAGLLLTMPDILLLDEPVKCMDAKAKKDIGGLMRKLAEKGMCIILVSHDTEFCASYADRCTMFFDGKNSETEPPYEFFSKNVFFTTSARRMTRYISDDIVTDDDLLYALDIQKNEKPHSDFPDLDIKYKNNDPDTQKKKKSIPKSIFRLISLAVFLFGALSAGGILKIAGTAVSAAAVIVSGLVLIILGRSENQIHISRTGHSTRGLAAAVSSVIVAVPLTIFAGRYFFNDSRYMFISLLILLECMLPFFVMFEKRRVRSREIVLIAVMCGLCVFARAAFYMLPEFKPMTAMVILTGAALGVEAGFLTGAVTMLVSNIIFSQGPWTAWQMAAMGLVGLLSGIVFGTGRITSDRTGYAVFGFFAAVIIYGGIMDPAALIISHIEPTVDNLLAYYAAGLPLDIVHGLSTAIFLYIGAEPVIKKLERAKLRSMYGKNNDSLSRQA